jgi:hypothetical protein
VDELRDRERPFFRDWKLFEFSRVELVVNIPEDLSYACALRTNVVPTLGIIDLLEPKAPRRRVQQSQKLESLGFRGIGQ